MEVKSKKYCKLIDRYRDGELDADLHAAFDSHLAGCPECRTAIALLNNLVRILHPVNPAIPPTMPERIARQAFARGRTWDAQVVSWLRPAPAWIALAVSLAIGGVMWISPKMQPVDAYSEYETLTVATEAASAPTIQSPEDLAVWLQNGGAR